ncbi:MAG TPA: hypothetical protein PLJ37_00945 [Chitinophagales bacterium]|nr:hypothetical protein [Chitinophagales bacterium]HMW93394.1 hypothetical protein [Chitinophagales bacterium]HMZ92984.1 hypothetical protein [Chitinophagales bacterium]HNG25953.1 hypothetical protein [Chitinophagales bacterium]
MDTFDQKMILNADNFLKSYGIVSDYHKNNIIISCLCICKYSKNVRVLLNSESKKMIIVFLVSKFSYYFRSKSKVVKDVINFINQYFGGFEVTVKFEKIQEYVKN